MGEGAKGITSLAAGIVGKKLSYFSLLEGQETYRCVWINPFDSIYSNIGLKDSFQEHQGENSSNSSLDLYIFIHE